MVTDGNEEFDEHSQSKVQRLAFESSPGRKPTKYATNPIKPKNIADLLTLNGSKQIEHAIIFNVTYLQDYMPAHAHVTKNRRRMVLTDTSGQLNGYIIREDEVNFAEGDTISACDFKFHDGAVYFYENSTAFKLVYIFQVNKFTIFT